MFRATVLFPARRGARFDWAYYAKDHTAFVKQLLGPALKRVELAKTRGAMGGIPTTTLAISLFYFDTMEILERSMVAAAPNLLEAISKFTDVAPQILIEEVL
jgi:uncharacterized protein (TIGR02118 family)